MMVNGIYIPMGRKNIRRYSWKQKKFFVLKRKKDVRAYKEGARYTVVWRETERYGGVHCRNRQELKAAMMGVRGKGLVKMLIPWGYWRETPEPHRKPKLR